MEVTLDTLRQAQEGDYDAQQLLMQTLYTPVFHFLLKRTGNYDVASELCQNTFLKCYDRVAHYDPKVATVYTWVFTIARNTLIDHFRKKQSESVDDLSDVPASDTTSDPTAATEARMDGEYVAKLLENLPETEADIITLRAIEEMPYEDIAAIVDKSEAATRQIYSRALKKLREINNQTTYA